MASDVLDDDYEEYDEIEDDEEEDEDEGLSGLVVLLMGVVMLGAIASVVWIAYQHGLDAARQNQPYVTADPEPLKIENDVLTADASDNLDREVYDQFNGAPSEPVEVIASGPEEPVNRPSPGGQGATGDNPLTRAAPEQIDTPTDDEVADRIAALAAADEELRGDNGENDGAPAVSTAGTQATSPTAASTVVANAPESAPSRKPVASTPTPTTPSVTPTVSAAATDDGGYVVQVAAVGSSEEADAAWTRLSRKMGGLSRWQTPRRDTADER